MKLQVLKFHAFFQEPVVEDANENFRVRKCIIFYYLDDDTLHIIEPRVENSGIPQGIFLKRHKLPFPDDQSRYYTWRDLNLSCNLNVYQRIFRIVDCDDFTRRFYQNEGCPLNAPESQAEDNFAHTRAMINYKQTPPDQAEVKEYIEVQLKGGRPNKALESFLNNDRKVLSFNILWEDRSYDGGDKFYVFNYYLSDGKVEVKEINTQNSGRFPFPMLLKKQRLAKAPILTHCPGMSLKSEEYYGPADLVCGNKVVIYGRECLIYDCDDFTKAWYGHNMGVEQNPIKLSQPVPVMPKSEIPSYNGYGSPEDSLGSVFALKPKAPKIDMKKMFKQDMHVLRFDAKLVSTEPDDETRNFIIMFYCGDDTLQIYEICDKNSGRQGGRFMKRKKQTNPETDAYYCEADLYLGRQVHLAGFTFMLMSADEYTEKYMEDNPDIFPEASVSAVIEKIKEGAKEHSSLQDYAVFLMKTLDKNNDGFVSLTEFSDALHANGVNTSRHEDHALLRRFDHNGDGKISMEEFYNTLAASF